VSKRLKTKWWVLVLGAVATAGLAVSLAVLAGGEGELIVTPYSDVIRFEAPGVASLQVQIYDLSGKLLWDSGVVSGTMVDWDRTDEYGERLAYGTYLYLVQGWSVPGDLVLQKRGKLALLPGDRVQLQNAPVLEKIGSDEADNTNGFITNLSLNPLSYTGTNLYLSGELGVGTDSPHFRVSICDGVSPEPSSVGIMTGSSIGVYGDGAAYFIGRDVTHDIEYAMGVSVCGGTFIGAMTAHDLWLRTNNQNRLTIKANSGNVGIGTDNPTSKLTVNGVIESTNGGFKFPDGTVQVTAAAPGGGAGVIYYFSTEHEMTFVNDYQRKCLFYASCQVIHENYLGKDASLTLTLYVDGTAVKSWTVRADVEIKFYLSPQWVVVLDSGVHTVRWVVNSSNSNYIHEGDFYQFVLGF